jgi:hypothetical protein
MDSFKRLLPFASRIIAAFFCASATVRIAPHVLPAKELHFTTSRQFERAYFNHNPPDDYAVRFDHWQENFRVQRHMNHFLVCYDQRYKAHDWSFYTKHFFDDETIPCFVKTFRRPKIFVDGKEVEPSQSQRQL